MRISLPCITHSWLALTAVGGLVAEANAGAVAGHQRVQEIALTAGWNAVYLAVEPTEPAPEKVFAGLPVDTVATLFENPVSNQFVTDPSVDLLKAQGWGVWYAPGKPEAFLKSLDGVLGNRAYLVHAKSACTWKATGDALMPAIAWRPDDYNFVGFGVRAQGGPTFAEFFAGSKAHTGQAIYRLSEGRWKKVLNPASETMRAGEAFWIYTKGSSDFQGPLGIETVSGRGLLLGKGADQMIFRNTCNHPLAPVIEQVPAKDGPPLPLSFVVKTFGDASQTVSTNTAPMPTGAWEQALPPLEGGKAIAVPMQVRSSELLKSKQGSLLKVTTDLGTEAWVPVNGFRDGAND